MGRRPLGGQHNVGWAMMPDSTEPSRVEPSGAAVDIELQPAHAPGFAAIVRLHGEHDVATGGEIHAALEPVSGDGSST
jgi:hypothetical protein